MLQLLIYPVDEVLVPAEALSVTSASFMSYLVNSLELAPGGVDHTPASLIFSAVQLNAGNKVGAADLQILSKELAPTACLHAGCPQLGA